MPFSTLVLFTHIYICSYMIDVLLQRLPYMLTRLGTCVCFLSAITNMLILSIQTRCDQDVQVEISKQSLNQLF